ncbi:hypothetical protein LCGC14_3075890 [marine sediment metagenome]|uniref:Uncharacterized protein n=1 Tax=marine sediment metagenome TaxID=412755 RepID=A0A0F8YM90_9ZZZZ
MNKVGHAVFCLGPSGTGKSSFARSAMLYEGSGLILSAPGVDEFASYEMFKGELGYKLHAMGKVAEAQKWLLETFKLSKAHLAEHGKPLFKVLTYDTLSGIDQQIRQGRLKTSYGGIPPKARTGDGADFYMGVQYDWERLMSLGRAHRGLGTHFIGLCHGKIRPKTETEMISTGTEAGDIVTPMLTGTSREAIPGAFDLCVHTTIKMVKGEPKHVMQWKADPTKVTKSRYGSLADNKFIPNDWAPLCEVIDKANAVRTQEFKAMKAAR